MYDVTDLKDFPKIGHYKQHGLTFMFKRQVDGNSVERVNIYYFLYVRKKFLWIEYWSSICECYSRVTKSSIKDARNFIDKYYLYMNGISYNSYD